MAKIKITSEQYNKILLHEQKSRSLITEASNEVVLGVAMLSGLKLSGQNELTATNALKDSNVMSQIKIALEDSDKLKELITKLEEKGMKNPEKYLSKKSETIISGYNTTSKVDKLDIIAKTNLSDLDGN